MEIKLIMMNYLGICVVVIFPKLFFSALQGLFLLRAGQWACTETVTNMQM